MTHLLAQLCSKFSVQVYFRVCTIVSAVALFDHWTEGSGCPRSCPGSKGDLPNAKIEAEVPKSG